MNKNSFDISCMTFLFLDQANQRWPTYLSAPVAIQSKTTKPRNCRFIHSPVLNNLPRKADAFFQDSGFIKEQPIMTDKELPGGLCLRLFQGFTEY